MFYVFFRVLLRTVGYACKVIVMMGLGFRIIGPFCDHRSILVTAINNKQELRNFNFFENINQKKSRQMLGFSRLKLG